MAFAIRQQRAGDSVARVATQSITRATLSPQPGATRECPKSYSDWSWTEDTNLIYKNNG